LLDRALDPNAVPPGNAGVRRASLAERGTAMTAVAVCVVCAVVSVTSMAVTLVDRWRVHRTRRRVRERLKLYLAKRPRELPFRTPGLPPVGEALVDAIVEPRPLPKARLREPATPMTVVDWVPRDKIGLWRVACPACAGEWESNRPPTACMYVHDRPGAPDGPHFHMVCNQCQMAFVMRAAAAAEAS